jgi:TolA-binding protein
MRTIILLYLAGSWLGWSAVGLAQSPPEDFRLAAEAYQTKNWAEASARFSALIAAAPAAPESRVAWFYLGETQTQLGENEPAATAYRNFLLLVGDHPHREKARFRLAEQAYLQGLGDAVSQCEGFLQAFPGSAWQPEVLAYLGQLRLQRAEPQLAARVFETALQRFPDHPLADENRLGLAAAQIRLGAGKQAEQLLKELEQRRNDNLGQRARFLLALRELEAGDRVSARQRLEAILSSNALSEHQLGEPRFWLARILTEDDLLGPASDAYGQALQGGLREPQLSTALTEWTAVHLKLGTAAAAADELARLQQTAVAQPWTRSTRELVLALEARLAYEAERFDDAAVTAETYRVSYPAGPSYRQVTELAGRSAYALGDYTTAAERFEELVRTPGLDGKERANYRYQLACQQVASKEYSAARSTLAELESEFLSADVGWQVKRLQATALEGEGRPKEALTELRQLALQAAPGDEEAQRQLLRQTLHLAIRQEHLETVSACWPRYRALGGLSNNDSVLVQRVGDLAYRNQDWALATDCYRELAGAAWGLEVQADGWAGLAWTALAEQRPEAAREAFETLVSLPITEERKAEAYLPLGNLLDESGETTEAIAMYQRAMTQTENAQVSEVARFKSSIALHKLGTADSLLEAYDLLQSLASLPESAVPADQVAYRLAWIEEELGRETDASQRFVRFLKQFPESPLQPDVVFRVAALELQRGELDAAEARLALVDLSQLPAELRERLSFIQGQIAAERSQWSKVIPVMETLASGASEPGLRDKSAYWLAEAWFQSGEYLQALQVFERLLGQRQLHLTAQHRAGVELRRLECLVALEDWPAALAASEPSASERKTTTAAELERQLLRGRALFALGRLNDALDCFEQVASTESESERMAEVYWRIGETRLAQEDYSNALSAYQESLAAGDVPHWEAAALLQAGKCEERLGNRTGALLRYRELLKRFPESEFALQARRRAEALERRARSDELIRR